jgi:stearoyl-CoA desaturase (delta-9 desaturase)
MSLATQQKPANFIAWGPVAVIGALHVLALLAFVPAFFSWSALLVCVVLHWLTGGIGICLTYHRLLTHRSFATRPKWLEYVLTAFGCCAFEGGPIGWVADHRRHHAHSDEEDDVHSPNEGFGWAHMFWWVTPDITSRHTDDYMKKWAPDLLKDPALRWLNTWHIVIAVGMLVGLYAIGGMPWLVWGGFVRAVLVLHTTWLVNSAAHIWGYRSHETRDKSTNLWWVAAVTYGEGWHNNHHAFQTSARHGLAWWEFDPTYWTIRVMQVLGLAHSVKLPKRSQRAAGPILTHAAGASAHEEAPVAAEPATT